MHRAALVHGYLASPTHFRRDAAILYRNVHRELLWQIAISISILKAAVQEKDLAHFDLRAPHSHHLFRCSDGMLTTIPFRNSVLWRSANETSSPILENAGVTTMESLRYKEF
jgi:hypothetical protein